MDEILKLFDQLDDSGMLIIRKGHIKNTLEFQLSERLAGDRWQVSMIYTKEFLQDVNYTNIVFDELIERLKNH